MRELDYLIEFSTYLKSSEEKYKFLKHYPFCPYSYSKKLINFFVFWCRSNYYTSNYKSIHDYREFTTNSEVNIAVLLTDVTYMIRRERSCSGFVATQIDVLEKLIDCIIEKELCRNQS